MAKTFYEAKEAAAKLGMSEDDLKGLVRQGKIREFRDAGKFNYKVDEVERLAAEIGPAEAVVEAVAEGGASGASASGEIILEPVEESGIELAASGSSMGLSSDILGLSDSGAEGTSSGTKAAEGTKGDTVVPSVGVNVFDDDELDEHVDPLAQTAVTDVGGLGLEGIGSGSGILDLTRESDDTSLGKELLDEIYTDDEDAAEEAEPLVGAEAEADAADATKAGLTEAVSAEEEGEGVLAAEGEPAAGAPRGVVREVVEYGPDAVTTSLTAVMVVAVVVMWVAGLGSAALVRGVLPGVLQAIYGNLWMYSLGALVAAIIAGGLTFVVARKGGA